MLNLSYIKAQWFQFFILSFFYFCHCNWFIDSIFRLVLNCSELREHFAICLNELKSIRLGYSLKFSESM